MMINAYEYWLTNAKDKNILGSLERMKNNSLRRELCFGEDMCFGTAGIRGVMDAGNSCINVYTIARVTAGLTKYLINRKAKRVAISFDSRINSEKFAKIAAGIVASSGIEVVMSSKVQPSPVLSFMTRYYKADAGIMITASHNSKKYNGYKVYNSDGCQIDEATAKIISEYIKGIGMFETDIDSFETMLEKGMIQYLSGVAMHKYIDNVMAYHYHNISKLTVVYTPLNGAGYRIVPEVLNECGANLIKVVEQAFPNGNFTTCPYPNPEQENSFELALRYAKNNKADLILATDPDCDRVGVIVLHKGEYVHLSGNEIGILLTEYLLHNQKTLGILPSTPIVVKSIVSTNLIEQIVNDYDGKVVNVLTGFKYIGEYIKNEPNCVFGFEESCGYLAGDYVRDKDGVQASMLIAEMCSELKKKNHTLIDKLNSIYTKYGKYTHKQLTYTYEALCRHLPQEKMAQLRATKFENINGIAVKNVQDLLLNDKLPNADVLIYNFIDNSQMIVRPSGTEPKIKLYLTAVGDNAQILFERLQEFGDTFFRR